MEREVDNQVAAPAETRTPNLHRANKSLIESADGRVATVATRREKKLVQRKDKRTHLTPTGLLMEGVYTNYDPESSPTGASYGVLSAMAMFTSTMHKHSESDRQLFLENSSLARPTDQFLDWCRESRL